ncbi:MAG TPA: retropepsin-like aspartic protease [Sphingomicrobium sp.]|nr:retropepsin-like aspartic protease [Sphingomicrobium sp.]
MRLNLALGLAALLAATGCRELGTSPPPDYRPEQAGTVDHALCLLGFTALPVREVATGHHLIEATINGRTGDFVLDTGANMSVIDDNHLEDFGIAAGAGALGGAVAIGGGGQARRVRIDSFEIGGVDVRQNRIVTSNLGNLLTVLGRASGTRVDGIIGQDVLTEHRAIIDVARPMLYLMEADRDPSPVPSGRCGAPEPAQGG